MEFTRYEPQQPPAYEKQIMNQVIMMQRNRFIKIQKPLPISSLPMTKPETNFKSFEIIVPPLKNQILKRKIIKKIKSQKIDAKMQTKAQNLLNLHLLYKLNQSALQMADKKIPPPFSILDSKEQGDYLPDGQKKQYPHFSNTLKPTQIPQWGVQTHLPKIKKLQKIPLFNIQQNCVFKIKQVYQFPKLIFRQGNQQFSKIANQLQLSECNTKLLYDLFNDYFDIEDRIDGRMEQHRKKFLKRLKNYLHKTFNKYKNKDTSSDYIPLEEQFISLKQIRVYLNAKRQESESSDED